MAKTNFSKSEEALDELIQRMNRERLLQEADIASGKTPTLSPELELVRARVAVLQSLLRSLKKLHKVDRVFYKELKFNQKALASVMARIEQLTDEEWEKILAVVAKIDHYFKSQPKSATDSQLVEQGRSKHINKRLNVSDRWLPLQ